LDLKQREMQLACQRSCAGCFVRFTTEVLFLLINSLLLCTVYNRGVSSYQPLYCIDAATYFLVQSL
jgi:hypothetical protein